MTATNATGNLDLTDPFPNVPATWERKRFKLLGRWVGGGTPSKDNASFWEGDIPWVSPKDMRCRWIEDTEDHISPEAIAASSTRMVPTESVLIVVRSGILKHSIPVAITRRPVAINQDIRALLVGRHMDAGYLAWLIEGAQDKLLLAWRKAGATVESIEYDYLANTLIPVPPLPLQKEIAAFLDTKIAVIDEVLGGLPRSGGSSRLERLTDTLHEYREAVIMAAVTGDLASLKGGLKCR